MSGTLDFIRVNPDDHSIDHLFLYRDKKTMRFTEHEEFGMLPILNPKIFTELNETSEADFFYQLQIKANTNYLT